jgi:hypothetical protein
MGTNYSGIHITPIIREQKNRLSTIVNLETTQVRFLLHMSTNQIVYFRDHIPNFKETILLPATILTFMNFPQLLYYFVTFCRRFM